MFLQGAFTRSQVVHAFVVPTWQLQLLWTAFDLLKSLLLQLFSQHIHQQGTTHSLLCNLYTKCLYIGLIYCLVLCFKLTNLWKCVHLGQERQLQLETCCKGSKNTSAFLWQPVSWVSLLKYLSLEYKIDWSYNYMTSLHITYAATCM